MKIDKGLIDRFWAKVEKGPGCWEWTAGKLNGYGRIGLTKARGYIFAHRLSYQIHFGSIPDNLKVLHKCDNPGCVRPDHLFIGTMGDNNRDRARKGRSRPVKGESHGMSKIANQDVIQIRLLYESGRTVTSLANEFGISRSQVSGIVHGRYWRHIGL